MVIDQALFDILSDETKKIIKQIQPNANDENQYEVLWTTAYYINSNGETEIRKFNDLFLPASNLWKYYKDKPSEKYYFDFMKLIVEGTLCAFSNFHLRFKAYEYIQNTLKELGLEQMKDTLMGSI